MLSVPKAQDTKKLKVVSGRKRKEVNSGIYINSF
jgi:hypothetical protein